MAGHDELNARIRQVARRGTVAPAEPDPAPVAGTDIDAHARGEPRDAEVDPNVWLRRLLGGESFPDHRWMRRG